MTCRIPFLAVVPLAALLAACSEGREPVAPQVQQPAGEASLLMPAPAMSSAAGTRELVMLDACDPASFNEFFGFEACTPTTPRQGMPFDVFVAQLELHQRVDAWRFAPHTIRVPRETTFRIVNRGGIVHSFTEVQDFGGGFIPLLNQLSGNPDMVAECDPAAIELIAPGDHAMISIEPGEQKKYMCCVHPWMRAETH